MFSGSSKAYPNGAGGFVLANDEASGDSLVGDAYPIPGVGISYVNGLTLKAWLDSGTGHTASIAGTKVSPSASSVSRWVSDSTD